MLFVGVPQNISPEQPLAFLRISVPLLPSPCKGNSLVGHVLLLFRVLGGTIVTRVWGGTIVTRVWGGTIVTRVSEGTIVTRVSGGTIVTRVLGGTIVTRVLGRTIVIRVSGGTIKGQSRPGNSIAFFSGKLCYWAVWSGIRYQAVCEEKRNVVPAFLCPRYKRLRRGE